MYVEFNFAIWILNIAHNIPFVLKLSFTPVTKLRINSQLKIQDVSISDSNLGFLVGQNYRI